MFIPLTGFVVCAALIFICGKYLSKYGDLIADHLGLGKAWIGLILMASVTSLPELAVGISSAGILQAADLALGDILGSCVFNIFILSLLDAIIPRQSLFSKASSTHILAASMSIILVALVGVGLFLPVDIVVTRWIGLTSIVFIVVYLVAMRLIFRFEIKKRSANKDEVKPLLPVTLKTAVLRYILNAVIVIGAALFLPGFAEDIAVQTGLGESFVGTLFLAASTSLPEVAVSIAAVRSGLADMAIGNLVGSNIFNILILAIDDMFYTHGPILKSASDKNLLSVFSVIVMTAVMIAGLTFQNQARKRFLLAWDTLLILVIFILNMVLLYWLR